MPEEQKRAGNYWFRSGFFTLIERLGVQLIGMLSLVLLLSRMGEADFGVWALFIVIGAFTEMGRTGLLQNGLVKFLNNQLSDDDERALISASTLLNVSLSLLISLALYLLAPWFGRIFDPQLTEMIRIYVWTNILLAPMTQGIILQQANMSFHGIFFAQLARQFSFFVAIVYLRSTTESYNLLDLAWGHAIAATIGTLVSIGFSAKFWKSSFQISGYWLGQLLRFGVFTFGTSISTLIYKTIDRIMLGYLLSTSAVGLMEPALRITNIMEIPVQAMAAIAYPQSAKRYSEKGHASVRYLYEKAVGTVMAIVLPISLFVICFPKLCIWLITAGNEAYAGAVPILQVTILYTLFVPFGRQFGTTLDSIGKPRWSFFFVFTGAILNIVSTYIFIGPLGFGVIGAAYGTLLTLGIKFIAQQIILYRILRVHTLRTLVYTWEFYRMSFNLLTKFLRNPATAWTEFREGDKKTAAR
jgi:O-antigen/teichoic acid export membrane protein